jgi:hypothetical protein
MNLGNLKIVEVYLYYDGPALFLADDSKNLFLSFWVGDSVYLYIPITEDQVKNIDKLLLKSFILGREYVFRAVGDVVSKISPDELLESELPDDVTIATN